MTKYSMCYYFGTKDSTVALFKDNELIYCKEEERFTRNRHASSFPYNAINAALKFANIRLEDVEHVIGKNESELIHSNQQNCRVIGTVSTMEELEKLLESMNNETTLNYSHHTEHALQSYATSGFKDKAAFLVMDGVGDRNDSITIGTVDVNGVNIIKAYSDEVSVGAMYSRATYRCGFRPFQEGKLMGLASYGTDTGVRLLQFRNGEIDKLMSFDDFCKSIYPFCSVDSSVKYDTLQYANLARTVQEQFNEIILNVAKYLAEITHCKKLVLSGGCAQNCIANNLICESGLFEEVYCSPIPYDGGTCIGECFAYAKLTDTCRVDYPCFGKDENVEDFKPVEQLNYRVREVGTAWLVKRLTLGKIFGWFQGGSEFGPRALGHRSFLANPAIPENLYMLNKIKSRELWRPLAPIVPEELFDRVFDVKNHDLFQFMLRTTKIRPEYRQKLAAVCHVDGTTRPQLLKREWNPELYDLIMKFYEFTGIPALINTSLNTHGRPIVETVSDAFYEVILEENVPVVFNAKTLIETI